jgi:putative membrane protein
MITDALLAYGHFLSMITTVAALAVEAVLCRPRLSRPLAKVLGRVDIVYFVAAILALTTGFLRVFWGLKGSAFYLNNPVFYTKVGLFLLVALLSIPPTIQFIRWGRQAADVAIPPVEIARVNRFLYIELALLALIPLLGSLMARGFGY